MLESPVSRPETAADYLMGIGFAGDRIRLFVHRRQLARKSRGRQIERTPEEMNRARFSNQPRAESLRHAIRIHQNAMEPFDGLFVVGGMVPVFIEWRVVVKFNGPAI